MRHQKAHRKLGRTSEHRMSMLRNLAVSLINAREERIVTTLPKAKELRPFVERAITLSRKASNLEGDDTGPRALHLRRQAAGFFHAGNMQAVALTGKRGQARLPRTAGVAALKRLFDELGERYKDRPGGYTRILKLGRRAGDNAELAIIELVDNQGERDALEAAKKRKSAAPKKKKASEPKSASRAKAAPRDEPESATSDVEEIKASAETASETVAETPAVETAEPEAESGETKDS
ncbi:MAG TPA: 50S ribosomal protein L17 [Pyrinomonadaceae bacterium]|jgi:large subunit ribosomal protein L17|nr:50S ribosomal protein L17 [Pyrinomonadaceae bacterium]